MKPSAPQGVLVLALTLVFFAVGGCSKPPKPADPVATNLYLIAQAYDLHIADRHRPPQDEADLAKTLKTIDETRDPSEVLRSPRDGQPYVIVYGAPLDSSALDVVLAHEKDGAEGKRYVLTQAGYVKVLSDAEFTAAPMAKSTKPRKVTKSNGP